MWKRRFVCLFFAIESGVIGELRREAKLVPRGARTLLAEKTPRVETPCVGAQIGAEALTH